MDFKEALYQFRRERGLNQEQLAEKIDVSRQAVSKWETGEASPDLPNLLALADALDVSLDTLCGRADREAAAPPPSGEMNAAKNPYGWIRALITAILIAILIPVLLIFANYVWPETAGTTVETTEIPYVALDTQSSLRLTESLSSVEFALSDGGLLTCHIFCGAENAGTFHYRLQFIDDENNVLTIPAEYHDGIITASGTASLHELHTASRAALSVSDDDEATALLLIPLASNIALDYSTNTVTWNPIL